MDTIPFAEYKAPPPSDDVLVNDLDMFPPLSLTTQSPLRTLHEHDRPPHGWQLVEGLVFSATPDDGNGDQWEDVNYSSTGLDASYSKSTSRSFAEIAEQAGTDHDVPIIRYERFFRYPKSHNTSFSKRRRPSTHNHRCSNSASAEEEDMLSHNAIFENVKSRSRLTRRQIPIVYRRRERYFKTTCRGEPLSYADLECGIFGTSIMRDYYKQNVLRSRVCATQAKLDRLDERVQQKQERHRSAKVVKAMVIEEVVKELTGCGKLALSRSGRRKAGQRGPISQYNTVVHHLQQHHWRAPMNKWSTFYGFLRGMYEMDMKALAHEQARFIELIRRMNNRGKIVRDTLKSVSRWTAANKKHGYILKRNFNGVDI